MKVPDLVIDHCKKYRFCKGCPLGTCTAPHGVDNPSDPRWTAWVEGVQKKVEGLGK